MQSELWNTLNQLYHKAINRIGLVRPEVWGYPGVRQAEDRVNFTWLNCMRGKATLEDFRTALKTYEETIMKIMAEKGTLRLFE